MSVQTKQEERESIQRHLMFTQSIHIMPWIKSEFHINIIWFSLSVSHWWQSQTNTGIIIFTPVSIKFVHIPQIIFVIIITEPYSTFSHKLSLWMFHLAWHCHIWWICKSNTLVLKPFPRDGLGRPLNLTSTKEGARENGPFYISPRQSDLFSCDSNRQIQIRQLSPIGVNMRVLHFECLKSKLYQWQTD